MAYPNQTFASIALLQNYINTKIVTNGTQEIDAVAMNNVLNSLCTFIVEYTMNGSLANVENSSGQVIVVSKPITIFTGAPLSVQWPLNVQNEYYLINETGYDIPISAGYSYVDVYENEKTIIPARQVVHIAKTISDGWVQVNNVGGGGSADLPPQAGNSGKVLATNGSTPFWVGTTHKITEANFTSARECPLPQFAAFDLEIFWCDLPNFIFESADQWQPIPGGGFEILLPGFDSSNGCTFVIMLKAKS